ncbi:MAG TPA: threonylcarbamoyl-AMP synthase [Candidatus Borkfalkia faecigallinarum]|uniref:Threonylcarbamoyl-AMP synthase n=1 Tax=Candidatus Borkfalkia faecigallinarum TaxID=2838509 RepID=A0A9D1VVI1_9FIRM|nr:threonylcarbamoyl-AMP synthase [Candidatus Borkfalkia faecigallinarum]
MQTEVQKIGERSLARAKELLLRGECVAFPTETVYGLGADARSDEAVERIYRVKGRPQDNPLIVHIHPGFDLGSLVYDEPYAQKLREAFLPGPLTLVYRSRGRVSAKVSCGLDTLAVRVPAHPEAQRFLRYVDIPVAAPSANRSKHVSPVSAQHVLDDLNGKIPLILDGGPCLGGIESTVCDITGPYPVILRAGLVTREMIAGVVGRCDEYIPQEGEKVRSPGMKYKHYAPSCETKLFAPADAAAALAEYRRAVQGGRRVRVLCEDAVAGMFPAEAVLDLGADGAAMAENLYRLLREAETCADLLIAIEPAGRGGVMTGVLNRLRKACAGE